MTSLLIEVVIPWQGNSLPRDLLISQLILKCAYCQLINTTYAKISQDGTRKSSDSGFRCQVGSEICRTTDDRRRHYWIPARSHRVECSMFESFKGCGAMMRTNRLVWGNATQVLPVPCNRISGYIVSSSWLLNLQKRPGSSARYRIYHLLFIKLPNLCTSILFLCCIDISNIDHWFISMAKHIHV